MTSRDELLRLAEWWESWGTQRLGTTDGQMADKTAAAIRSLLAQKPVGRVRVWNRGGSGEFKSVEGLHAIADGTDLYTAPFPAVEQAARAAPAQDDEPDIDDLSRASAPLKVTGHLVTTRAAPAQPTDVLRDHRVLLATCLLHPLPLSLANAIKETLSAPAQQSVSDPDCNYLMTAGNVCNKCGRIHRAAPAQPEPYQVVAAQRAERERKKLSDVIEYQIPATEMDAPVVHVGPAQQNGGKND
jgi:hypothetical protein